PRMVCVQAEGCAPIVKAYRDGEEFAPLFPNAHTCASGLRVPVAVGDFLMIRAIRESEGTAMSISDEALMEGVRELSRLQGVYACPEGGAVWKAAQQLLADGWIKPHERVVLFNTGAGLKYNHLFSTDGLPRLDHTSDRCLDGIA
ncbi:MAG: pyridoxal-phosphate dependent enzyme, partial [Planctomycetaceae bacterium]|nr:pyridoxal-phosphate dependent enzyme [Planctomycetaceae bacterium]